MYIIIIIIALYLKVNRWDWTVHVHYHSPVCLNTMPLSSHILDSSTINMLLLIFVTHEWTAPICVLSPTFFHTVYNSTAYIVLEICYKVGSEITLLFSRIYLTLHLPLNIQSSHRDLVEALFIRKLILNKHL